MMTDKETRSDFLNFIRSKMIDLQSEIRRIQCERDSLVEYQRQYIALNKIVEDLRNELEDYNMARMNSFRDVNELKKEIDDLHTDNQQRETAIEEMSLEKRRKEEYIEQIESSPEYRLCQLRKQISGSLIHEEALSLIDQICNLEFTIEEIADNEIEQIYVQHLNDIRNIQQSNLLLLSQITHILPKENYSKLQQHLFKLEILYQNLTDELSQLTIKYKQIQDDLIKFNDLESLKRQADRRKQQLLIDKTHMSKQKAITQMEIQTLQSQFDLLQSQLQANETHHQLRSLEQKLQTLLIPVDLDYEYIKTQVLKLVSLHNQWLIERLN